MPSGKISTLQDAEDLVLGCLFLGTGGGGRAERGLSLLKQALEEGLNLTYLDAEQIPDNALTVTPYGMGSVAPASQEMLAEIERLGLKEQYPTESMAEAVKELGKYLGEPIGCLVPSEPGAANLPEPLVTGARLGIAVVDGDYAGRCIPDEMQSTPYLNGKHSWPFSSVDHWGNIVICRYTQNPFMLERIGKMLAVAAFGGTSMAATPLSGKEMKELVVRGTITKCLKIGQAIRQARQAKQDPIDATLKVTGGWRVFEGVVQHKDWEDRGGYMYGTTFIDGTGKFSGHSLKVWFKNENHVSWLDGDPWICSPDLLTLAYPDGRGTSNSTLAAGEAVVAVGIKGLEAFRSEFGLNQASGPRYFGFDIDYVPIEKIMQLSEAG
jgi:DUF917 family protein